MTRPQSIIWFERCYLGAAAVGLANLAVNWSAVQAQVDATPGAAMLPRGFMLGTIIAGLVINLLLWYFAARRAAVVAKWIIVVFFALGLVSMARVVLGGVYAPTANLLAIIAFALQCLAVWMLFRPDANRWFAGDPADDVDRTFP